MWFTKLALTRPVTISMVFVCALVMGMAATRMLPLEYLPSIQFPGVFIQANYPGGTPEEVEKNITKPLEEALATMGGVDTMQSTSREGQSTIFILFGWGVNAKLKGVEAREKVDGVKSQLPEDLRRVFIYTGSTNDQPIMEARLSANTDLSDSFEVLNRQLKQRLERIPGVARVSIEGVAAKTYQIELMPERLAAFHLDANQLLNRLRNANSLISAGEVKSERSSFRITLNQQFASLNDIKQFVVHDNGLKLEDVAKVSYAKDEITEGRHLDRKYAVGIGITREADANLVATADAVKEELKRIEQMPDFDGIEIYVMNNQADGVVASLKDIIESGLVGFLLSSLVLFVFLKDIRLTLIVSLAVPFSLFITMAVMYFLGISLNILSMMGLMLAIGMLVDNAVVVSESIFGYRQQLPGKPVEAAMKGVKDVGVPVVAGTLTTAIVFLPNVIGEMNDVTMFISNVAYTIVLSLAASLFIATTVIPLCLSRLKTRHTNVSHTDTIKEHGRYSRFLSWMMVHPKLSGVIVLALLGSVVIPKQFVKMDMFPEEESAQVEIEYNINDEYELEKVEQSVRKIEDFLYANREALDIESVYSWYAIDNARSNLILVAPEKRTKTNKEIKDYLEKNLPLIATGNPGFNRNRSGASEALSIGINGEDTETLLKLSEQIEPLLKTIKGVTQVVPGTRDGSQEVRVVLDPQKLNQLGLTPQQVASSISIALRKQQLKTFRSIYGEVDISLTFAGQKEARLSDLAGLPIELPNPKPGGNRNVRLDAVADLTVTRSMPSITRYDRRTSIRLNISYTDTTAAEVREAANKLMKDIPLPTGYSWGYGRSTEREARNLKSLSLNLGLAALMIFIVMAALFESLMLPLAVITSIVFAVVGVYWYFFITGTMFTMMAFIGILVLMGVVVNNGIVLVDRIHHYRKLGVERKEAVLHAANDRIRPILMTVLTTILGLLPLSIGETQLGGEGPPYYPMARAVIGGLGYSTIATLICLPVIYLFLDYTREFFANLWRSVGQGGTRWSLRGGKLSSRVKP